MKFSQSSFLYFNYPLEEAITRLAKMGYKGVDFWGGRPHAFCDDISSERAVELKKVLSDNGMVIPVFIPAQFRYPTHIASPYAEVRAKSVEYIKKSIDASLALGCKNVSLCPGHSLYGQGYEGGISSLVESCGKIMDYAGSVGATMYMEPAHPAETDLLVTVSDTVRFIKNNKFDGMGVCLDTGHCFVNKESLGDGVRMISENKMPMHIHIDDNGGMSDDHKVPGEGSINFEPFFRALKEVGYDGFITAELGWGYTTEPDAAAYKCKKALDDMAGMYL
jgi:protein FrlC